MSEGGIQNLKEDISVFELIFTRRNILTLSVNTRTEFSYINILFSGPVIWEI